MTNPTIAVPVELRSELERIVNDYIPGTQEEAALALEEMRAELHLLLASPQDSAGAVAEVGAVLSRSRRLFSIDVLDADALHPGTKLYTTPQPAAQAAEVAGEREGFEVWVRRDWPAAPLHYIRAALPKTDPRYGEYVTESLQRAWVGFQAGAAWQRTQSAGAPEGWREHPNSDPRYWPDALIVNEQSRELADWHALAAAPQPPQQPNPDVARLREVLEYVLETCPGIDNVGDEARKQAREVLSQTSGGE